MPFLSRAAAARKSAVRKNEGTKSPGPIGDAYHAWVQELLGRLTVERITHALITGGEILPDSDLNAAAAAVQLDLSRELGTLAGASGVDDLSTTGIDLDFGPENNFITAAARHQTAQLIQEISDEARASIRAVLAETIPNDLPDRQAAEQIRPLIGLTERDALAVQNARAKMIEDGATTARADKAAGLYSDRLKDARALNIATTERAYAESAGQQAAWAQARAQRAISDHAVKVWVAGDESCDLCTDVLDGQAVGLSESFDAEGVPVFHPPAHPRCVCTMELREPGDKEDDEA